ncbi:MAG: cysteine--1-D-myo-inosityl 2-amino-2-deoxy-alpha-D-glucopyranoside ligase [Mycobacteriales bacterium]
MESWGAPPVPPLPGTGLPVRVWDTASGELRPTSPGATATMYVCGITPYDATHLGHAATYLAFDLLNRAWRDGGHDVDYVQNVTDVDDPLLERATATGEDWAALAVRETDLFRADMTALRVLPPTRYVGAVEAVPRIIELIGKLQERGAAYDVDGDVYFSVAAADRFGTVAGLDMATMLQLSAERGGDPDRPGKKDPLDCLLWLAGRPGEPSWESPFGPGRPGWHVECAAIALERLGPTIDVQGGGSDLAFPHHELGAAEASVATGVWPFARAFVHTGMVGLDGEKMSKSRGNLVFVSRLRAEGVDPMAIRLALLAHHYRGDWAWTPQDLPAAQKRLARWRAAVAQPAGPPAEAVLDGVRRHLADDLDAPGALGVVDRWGAEASTRGGRDGTSPAHVVAAVGALLGVGI